MLRYITSFHVTPLFAFSWQCFQHCLIDCCLQGQLCGLFQWIWLSGKMIIIRRINVYQCESIRIIINTLIFINLCHLPLTIKEVRPYFFMWFLVILNDSHWFSKKPEIDSCWFSNKSKPWFSLILTDSWWFLMILADSWWFSTKSGIDSCWFLNKAKPWFSLILNYSNWFSIILTNSQ